MSIMHATKKIVWSLIAVGSLVSCAGDSGTSNVLDSIQSAGENESRERSYASVFEALPQKTDSPQELAASDRSQLVVTGRFVGASEGPGAIWDEEGSTRTDVDYNDPDAMMSVVFLTLQVDDVVDAGGEVGTAAPSEITIGQWVEGAPDIEAVAKEYANLGDVVTFLARRATFGSPSDTKVFNEVTDGVWSILESGAFVGAVDGSGRIEFPLLSEDVKQASSNGSALSLSGLRAAALEQ